MYIEGSGTYPWTLLLKKNPWQFHLIICGEAEVARELHLRCYSHTETAGLVVVWPVAHPCR